LSDHVFKREFQVCMYVHPSPATHTHTQIYMMCMIHIFFEARGVRSCLGESISNVRVYTHTRAHAHTHTHTIVYMIPYLRMRAGSDHVLKGVSLLWNVIVKASSPFSSRCKREQEKSRRERARERECVCVRERERVLWNVIVKASSPFSSRCKGERGREGEAAR